MISGTTNKHPKTEENTYEHINKYGHNPRMIITTVNSQQNSDLKNAAGNGHNNNSNALHV